MTAASITPASGTCEATPCESDSPRRYRVEVEGASAILCGWHASGVKNGYSELEDLIDGTASRFASTGEGGGDGR